MRAIRNEEAAALRRLIAEGATGEGEASDRSVGRDASGRVAPDRRVEAAPGPTPTGAAWERIWRDLELPPAAGAPPGFATRVLARVRPREAAAPAGLRWASAVALVAGIALGSMIARTVSSTPAAVPEEGEAGIAESYLEEWFDPSMASLAPIGDGADGESATGGS